MLKNKLYIPFIFVVILISSMACSDDIVKFPDHTQDPDNVIAVDVPESGLIVEGGSSFEEVLDIINGPASDVIAQGTPVWFKANLDSLGVGLTVTTVSGSVVPDSLQGDTVDVFLEAYADDKHVGGSVLKIIVN